MGTPLLPITYLFGDKRSYLYPGKNKNQLTAQERQLEELYDRIDRPGNRITPTQFFQTPEAAQLLDQLYGGLADRIPPGSQIVNQTPSKVTYRDKDGYEHNIIRKPDGQFTETTDRPPILPDRAQASTLDMLRQRVEQGLTTPATLAQLDPETAASLKAISDAEAAALEAGLSEDEARLVARLYGQGVNRSSIATGAAARFAEGAGRVRQQQRSDAAGRDLAVRNLLTTIAEQRGARAEGLLGQLSGQSTQRDIAGAGLGLEGRRIDEGARQFDISNALEQMRLRLAERDLEDRNSPLNQISRLIGVGTQAAGAVGGGLSAYRALTRG